MSKPNAVLAERVYLELVSEYQTAILNYIYRLVGDREMAEDLTQETYIKAYRALGRLELGEDAAARRRAWLYRIAHNAATDHLRRKARLRWLSLEGLRERGAPEPLPADGPDPEPGPEAGLAEREPVHRALAALNEAQRQVLLLFNHSGLSAAEVAEVLDISPAAARKRRQRASEAFREVYLDLQSGFDSAAMAPAPGGGGEVGP